MIQRGFYLSMVLQPYLKIICSYTGLWKTIWQLSSKSLECCRNACAKLWCFCNLPNWGQAMSVQNVIWQHYGSTFQSCLLACKIKLIPSETHLGVLIVQNTPFPAMMHQTSRLPHAWQPPDLAWYMMITVTSCPAAWQGVHDPVLFVMPSFWANGSVKFLNEFTLNAALPFWATASRDIPRWIASGVAYVRGLDLWSASGRQ